MNDQVFARAFIDGFQPDRDVSLADWGDEYRFLSAKGAAEPGPYRIGRTPYLKEIAEQLSPMSSAQRIVFMKSTQVGASELGFNWLGYIMHSVPAPTMMVQPTVELAEKISKQRIDSMIQETPVLTPLVSQKKRDGASTILLKQFRGGILSMIGANSGVGMRSMPARFVLGDEIDAWPHDIDGEGSPLSLLEKRTTTYGIRKKMFLISTPLVKGSSKVEAEYLKSDQRRFFVPCPHCGLMQHLQFKQLKWEHDKPETAIYECEGCQKIIPERFKTEMLRHGEWRATAVAKISTTVGYHINALYSPIGWKPWSEIVDEFLEAHRNKDVNALKAFANTVLGESFEEDFSERLDGESLRRRAEPYKLETAPAGVLCIFEGVDVQDNRIECTTWGFGENEEQWVIDHEVIFGDLSRAEIWVQLANRLSRTIPHETHADMKILTAAIDSGGHFTHEVYNFCRVHKAKNWIPIKGSSFRGKPAIGPPKKVDINLRGQLVKNGVELYSVGTDTVKSVIYGRLKLQDPGPGYIHFSQDLSPEFYDQLTAEKQTTKYIKGFAIKEWTKAAGARNEVLDTAVYGYAAFQKYLSRFNRKTFWAQMKNRMVPKDGIKVETEENKAKDKEIASRRRKSGGFVSGY